MMEKITDKINALPDGANYFSLEFFPPKTAMVCPTTHVHSLQCFDMQHDMNADESSGLRQPPDPS